MPHDNKPALEELHPSLWRASQLARASTRCVDSGHPVLAGQLPGGGWPTGELTELLISQNGIAELRLLAPAMAAVASRGIMLVQPPHPPQALAFAALGIAPSQLTWVNPAKTADALWATEQILKSNCTGCVLLWSTHIRNENLRRLHLAAQSSESLFFLLRPLQSAQDSSPAPLRLSLQPAADGIAIGFVKRRGPAREALLFLPLIAPGVVKRRSAPGHATPAPRPVEEPVRTSKATPKSLEMQLDARGEAAIPQRRGCSGNHLTRYVVAWKLVLARHGVTLNPIHKPEERLCSSRL